MSTGPSIESQLSKLQGRDLRLAMYDLNKKGELGKLSLNFMLMIVGKVQVAKKNEELETIQNNLKEITKDTQVLGKEMEKARKLAQANEAKSDDDTSSHTSKYRASQEVIAITKKIDTELGNESSGSIPRSPSEAVDRLSTYAKSLGDIAKNKTTEASKARSEFDAITNALTSMMRMIKEFRSKSTGSI